MSKFRVYLCGCLSTAAVISALESRPWVALVQVALLAMLLAVPKDAKRGDA